MMLKRSKVKVKGKAKAATEPALEQSYISGTEPVSVPEIDTAINVYMAAHQKLLQVKEEDGHAQGKLLELMHKHDMKLYKSKGKLVKITPGSDKVQVKNVATVKE